MTNINKIFWFLKILFNFNSKIKTSIVFTFILPLNTNIYVFDYALSLLIQGKMWFHTFAIGYLINFIIDQNN